MSENSSFCIDSHKLHLHPKRVADWLEGRTIAPLYLEVTSSGACNHRCRFCGMDFMGYKKHFLPTEPFCEKLVDFGASGVKSIMYAGEGEPFLHPEMARIATTTKDAGIDVAFTTNGVLLKPEILKSVLPVTTWIKVSCNAGTAKTYAYLHGTREQDFDLVINNMAEAVRLRAQNESRCTIGFQLLLLPENIHEATILARLVREIGGDYLVIKPYTQHPKSYTKNYNNLEYDKINALDEELRKEETGSFRIIFRHQAFQRKASPKQIYDKCLALPFWGYVDSLGTFYGCSRYMMEERYTYGNIFENSVKEVLFGSRRIENIAYCSHHQEITHCHVNCRMDSINAYLWELANPSAHSNFI